MKSMRAIAATWLFCFLVALIAPFLLLILRWASWETVGPLVLDVNLLYAPYCGVMIAYTTQATPPRRHFTSVAFRYALALSLLWNFFIILFLALPLFGATFIEDTRTHIREVSVALSWIVSPVLGRYLATDGRPA